MSKSSCKSRLSKCSTCDKFLRPVKGKFRISGWCAKKGTLIIFKKKKEPA